MEEEKLLNALHTDIKVIKEKLTSLNDSLSSKTQDNRERINDHEKRLRFLERYAFTFLGVIGLLSLGVSIVTNFI